MSIGRIGRKSPYRCVQALQGLNPSLSIVDGKIVVDPALDPFDPANGFNPDGEERRGFRSE